jgi:hypothetical protein
MSDDPQPSAKRFRLTGARFDGGRLPVDSLVELEHYQDVVRIAAEAEWRHDHPDEELPSDFRESVSLTIERIDEGSADVFLAFEQHAVYLQYQDDAQNAVDATIIAAYSGAPLPDLPALSPQADRDFRDAVAALGSTLEPGQTIEFYPDSANAQPVSITIETRKHAVDELARIEDFLVPPDQAPSAQALQKVEESLTGRVTAINADKQQFSMQTDVGEVHGWYHENPELLEDFRTLVNSAANGPLTRVSGELQLKNGEPWRFRSINRVEQVQFDDTAWGARLTEFASLPPRWDDGEAAQISSVALDASQKLLQAVDAAGVERPGVFPTSDGGVLIEWATPSGVRSVEVLSDGAFEMFFLARGQSQGNDVATSNLAEAVVFVTEAEE